MKSADEKKELPKPDFHTLALILPTTIKIRRKTCLIKRQTKGNKTKTRITDAWIRKSLHYLRSVFKFCVLPY